MAILTRCWAGVKLVLTLIRTPGRGVRNDLLGLPPSLCYRSIRSLELESRVAYRALC